MLPKIKLKQNKTKQINKNIIFPTVPQMVFQPVLKLVPISGKTTISAKVNPALDAPIMHATSILCSQLLDYPEVSRHTKVLPESF